MKANELMIGDWVQTNDLYKAIKDVKVRAISQYSVQDETTSQWIDCQHIEPIPLTKEILEKNGVEYFDCSFHFPEDDCLWLELNWEEDGLKWTVNCNEYDILPLDYVHELQHALKLCGIDKQIIL